MRWRFGLVLALLLGWCAPLRAADDYFAVLVDGKHVGYSRVHTEIAPEGRKTIEDGLVKLSLLGAPGQRTMQGICLMSRDGSRPLRYSVTLQVFSNKPITIDCRFHGGAVTIISDAPGAPASRTVPWTRDCLLIGEGMDHDVMHIASRLKSGRRSITARYLDILTQSVKVAPLTRLRPQTLVSLGHKHVCDVYALDSGASEIDFSIARDMHRVIAFRRQEGASKKAIILLADVNAMKDLGTFEAGTHLMALSDVNFPDPLALRFLKVRVQARAGVEHLTSAVLQTPWQSFAGTVKDGRIDGVFEIRHFEYTGEHAPPFTGKPPAENWLAAYVKPDSYVESGEETAECVAAEVRNGVAVSDWKFSARFNIATTSATAKGTAEGMFTVTDTDAPVIFKFTGDANGMAQSGTYAFVPGKVKASIRMGTAAVPHEVKREDGGFMLMSEITTHFSLMTRALRIQPGQQVKVPVFMIDTLQSASLVITARPQTETLKVGDQSVECVVCDEKSGARYWLDRKTGAIVRARIDAQKVVIDAVSLP